MWKLLIFLFGTAIAFILSLALATAVNAEEVRGCALYWQDDWWDVPEGTMPQVVFIEDTGRVHIADEYAFREFNIVTQPTDLVETRFDENGYPLVVYLGYYMTRRQVEDRVAIAYCEPPPIS